jgi:gamma-glutamylcyclotransferase (GGCT)/AIG2-like uncharacterized protein YtfP
MSVISHLFVYGTLAPGQPNAHILRGVNGKWQPAAVRGLLKEIGWGANMGYSGIELGEEYPWVNGMVLSSDNLDDFWEALDEFEGEDYQRVLTKVRMAHGEWLMAYVYQLAPAVDSVCA